MNFKKHHTTFRAKITKKYCTANDFYKEFMLNRKTYDKRQKIQTP